MSEEETIPLENQEEQNEEKKYESPEALTSFKKGPPWFDRKKVMMTLSIAFAGIVIAGVIFSSGQTAEAEAEGVNTDYAANVPRDFLQQEYERSLLTRQAVTAEAENGGEEPEPGPDFPQEDIPLSTPEQEEGLPRAVPVSLYERPERSPPPAPAVPYYPPPQPANQSGASQPQSSQTQDSNPYASPLVGRIEGTLFSSAAPLAAAPGQTSTGQLQYPGGGAAAFPPYGYPELPQTQNSYEAQNNQAQKMDFYNSASRGNTGGVFLGPNMLWVGTMIPAVLETAINTDLPGNVIARVTENMYDSETGRKMLIPQGTLLVAKYNSSISYAQRRVQIVWDVLIRPDGFQLELDGMNGVDPKGMAGIKAAYHENWFEYIKAAGIITMFSLANSKMAEEVAKYGSDDMAAGVASSNAEFMGEVGGNIISRAMDIQPTLTVDSGEKVNIMLNKNLTIPPMKNYPVTQKYALE